MRIIRASEIGYYVYCRKSWLYQRQGFEPDNQADLAAGAEMHFSHGRQVWASGCIRTAALALMLLALTLLVIAAVQNWI